MPEMIENAGLEIGDVASFGRIENFQKKLAAIGRIHSEIAVALAGKLVRPQFQPIDAPGKRFRILRRKLRRSGREKRINQHCSTYDFQRDERHSCPSAHRFKRSAFPDLSLAPFREMY